MFKTSCTFFWRTPGTLLVSGKGIKTVLRELTGAGRRVLGCEGFELDGPDIQPRLEYVYATERRSDVSDPCEIVATWPEDIWVDVVLTPFETAGNDSNESNDR